MSREPRTCFIVLETQFDSVGFIPSLVTEGEAGHSPLIGNGPLSAPWHWGTPPGSVDGWKRAQKTCAEENEALGLTPEDVLAITASSIGASIREGSASERYNRLMEDGRRHVG